MTNKHYRTVYVKTPPKQCNNSNFSEWVPVYSYETCIGEAMYDYENKCWQFEHDGLHDKITHWLEEYTPLTGYNVKEVLGKDVNPGDIFYNEERVWEQLEILTMWQIVPEETYLILVSPPLVDRDKMIEIASIAISKLRGGDGRYATSHEGEQAKAIVDALLPFIKTELKKEEK